MFLGDALNEVIDALIEGKELNEIKKARFQTGVSVIPDFQKDNTDRNRTSPFAFTGNKFEFRGVGSSQSIAVANTMLNSMLAATMKEMSNLIKEGKAPHEVIKMFLTNHKRVIFEGDGYSKAWEKEIKARGLSNRTNTVDSITVLKEEKPKQMLTTLGIFSESEINSRYEILLDSYSKTIQVEACTALKIAKNQIFPACLSYLNKITQTANNLAVINANFDFIKEDVLELSNLLTVMKQRIKDLELAIENVKAKKADNLEKAKLWKDKVLSLMNDLREVVDTLETKVDEKDWPMPTYIDLLFGIK